MLSFILIQNRQYVILLLVTSPIGPQFNYTPIANTDLLLLRGKTRLAKWYSPYGDEEKIKIKGEVRLNPSRPFPFPFPSKSLPILTINPPPLQ